jgi:hypothetical protein
VNPVLADVGSEGVPVPEIGAEVRAGALIDGVDVEGPSTPPGPDISVNPLSATGMVAPPVNGAAAAPPANMSGPIIF